MFVNYVKKIIYLSKKVDYNVYTAIIQNGPHMVVIPYDVNMLVTIRILSNTLQAWMPYTLQKV